MGFVSGLTMLGCDESESPNKSYADLADAIRRYCHPSVIRRDNEELFRRMVFNILVTNDDDHLRNHGFVWDPRLGGWALSPLYDVMPRAAVATDRYLHLGVGPQGRLATLDNALASHAKFTLSRAQACEVIVQVWGVAREWRVYFEQFGVPTEQMDRVATAFRHIDHVSSAQLRKLLS
jgi:serine/threonine-protein kinase HipA